MTEPIEPDETRSAESVSDDVNDTDVTQTPGSGPEAATEASESPQEEPETFPRAYVQRLRDENAKYRQRAARADEAEQRLMAATVREATRGVLADPDDLDLSNLENFTDEDGYPDPAAITQAARELVERKPHLADRRPRGDVGQGARREPEQVNLAALLRERAG